MNPLPVLRSAAAIIVVTLAASMSPGQAAEPAALPPVETLHRFVTVGDLRLARCINGKGGSAACYEAARQRGANLGAALASLAVTLLVLGPLVWRMRTGRSKEHPAFGSSPRFAYPSGRRSWRVMQTDAQASPNPAGEARAEEQAHPAAQMVA